MLGNAGEKIGTMVELAEDLYEKVTAMRQELEETTETVEDTNDRVASLEERVERQGEVLDAIADEHGIEVSAVTTDESGQDDADQ